MRTTTALALLEDAQDAGAAGVLLAPVSYQPLKRQEALGLYHDATASLDVPLVVYDNPGTTRFTFDDDLYAEVAAPPGVASIKIPGVPGTAPGAGRRIARLGRVLPAHITIGVSDDRYAALELNAGRDGWHSVVAGIPPVPAVALTRAACSAGARPRPLRSRTACSLRGTYSLPTAASELWRRSPHAVASGRVVYGSAGE